MKPPATTQGTAVNPSGLDLDSLHSGASQATEGTTNRTVDTHPILPQQPPLMDDYSFGDDDDDTDDFHLVEDDDELSWEAQNNPYGTSSSSPRSKKKEWLLRMSRKLNEIPEGELDPSVVPISAIMNAWAKTKSAQGASMVEMWLKRAQQEFDVGNRRVVPTTKMYTMAVDAWARSGEGGAAAQRAEALLQRMNELHQSGGHEALRPTVSIVRVWLVGKLRS